MSSKKSKPKMKDLESKKNPKGGSTNDPGGPLPPVSTTTKINKITDAY